MSSASHWRLMDTAPKDGTWILVVNLRPDEEERPMVAMWFQHSPLEPADWYYPGSGHFTGEGFRMNPAYCYDPPTHWMPLPPVPAALLELLDAEIEAEWEPQS